MSYKYFNEIDVLYTFNAKLKNLTPLSIGSGKSPTGSIDNPIIRMNGKPYIPGSTIKGILRSEAERYVRTMYGDDPKYVCDIFNPEKDGTGEIWRKDHEENYEPCLICKIFGGPTIASHIRIYDAFSLPLSYHTETRTCTSINRITGGQYIGRLFDIEYVTPNSIFEWTFDVENIEIMDESNESKVLKYLIEKMRKDGIIVGARRSIGFGKIKIDELKVIRYEFKDGEFKEQDVTEKLLK